MLELAARLRTRVLQLFGLASKRDLRAMEKRLDTLSGKFRRQTVLLERTGRRHGRGDPGARTCARPAEHTRWRVESISSVTSTL